MQASCSIRRRLTQETTSLSVPVSWEPDYDWTQLGERRIVFFRGDTSQFASKAAGSGGAPFPTILTFHTDITEAEIATAMPAPQDLLRNRASWSLPSGSGASDFRYPPRPDRLTEITLVDNHTRFIAQQAVTVLAIGAGTLFGLLAQSAAGTENQGSHSGGTSSGEDVADDSRSESNTAQRNQRRPIPSKDGVAGARRRRTSCWPAKTLLMIVSVVAIFRKYGRTRCL